MQLVEKLASLCLGHLRIDRSVHHRTIRIHRAKSQFQRFAISGPVYPIRLRLEELQLPLINDPDAPRTIADKIRAEQKSHHVEAPDLTRGLIEPETPMSSRDPIRMYLSQMGNIPLLSRDDEIFLAKEIEITRKRYRRGMMESDFAIATADSAGA